MVLESSKFVLEREVWPYRPVMQAWIEESIVAGRVVE